MLGELLDRVAAVEQNAGVAVDVGDRRAAARGGEKSRVVGKHARAPIERADVDDVRADGPRKDGEFERFSVGQLERGGLVGHIPFLNSAQARNRVVVPVLVRIAASDDNVPQVVVRQLEQRRERLIVGVALQVALQHEVELQQAAPAFPVKAMVPHFTHYTARLTMISLILLMARVGLRPFGHTSTQFMIVWQRNSRYGSSRLSRRSAVVWSRVSAMKRYACSSPAGPTNLSGFHQKEGQDVEQQAHRMHS